MASMAARQLLWFPLCAIRQTASSACRASAGMRGSIKVALVRTKDCRFQGLDVYSAHKLTNEVATSYSTPTCASAQSIRNEACTPCLEALE